MNGNSYPEQSLCKRPSPRVKALLKCLLLTTGLLCSSLMAANNNKLSRDLALSAATGPVDVIIQFTHLPSDKDLAPVARMGGGLKRIFPNIHGALMTLPAAALHGVAN